MSNDLSIVGFGVGTAILMFVIYIAMLVISLWIFYLIVRAAVTNGIMRASRQGAFQSMSPPPFQGHQPINPGGPTQGGPPFQG